MLKIEFLSTQMFKINYAISCSIFKYLCSREQIQLYDFICCGGWK